MENGSHLITIPPIEKNVPEEVYSNLEKIIWDEVNKTDNPAATIEPYIYPFENIQMIADSDKIEYKENIRNMADDIWSKEVWLDALIVYYILMHIITFLPTDFYKMSYTLGKLNYPDMAQKLIDVYEKMSTNKKVTYHAMANFYYTAVNIPEKALNYFQKYCEIDDSNPLVYNTMGYLYGELDDEASHEKQLEMFKRAYELKPDDPTIVKSLLTAYEKAHQDDMVKFLYPQLLNLAPSPQHSLNYGLYLMSWGQFNEGGKYFSERFDLENYPIGYPKDILTLPRKWNYYDDISDKTLVIHYEEGFGDSIMYGRFLPLIKQYAKNTVLIVQPQLVNLFKQSKILTQDVDVLGSIEEFSAKYKDSDYVHMPLMDMPYPLGFDTHFIPYTDAYITPSAPREFDKTKLSVGIAYSGDVSANYNGRDITVDLFENIMKSDKIQLYSLQVGETSEQISKYPQIIDLGKDFNDFTDTANAISGLDLVITSDNVILNLAGALGKRTYAIFNKYPNYRWFDLSGENVKWYNSVKPFQCDEENNWASAFAKVEEALKTEFLN